MTSEYLSSDFSYKKYSLEQLDNWVNDALNCEDLTPQDIYDTVIRCVDESVEYHKKYLTKSIDLLSLLKGHRSVDFDYTATGEKFPTTTEATDKDWIDFWEETFTPQENYNEEQVREFEAKERDYERKRAELDAEHNKAMNQAKSSYNDGWTQQAYADQAKDIEKELEEIRKQGGFEWTPESKHSKYYYDVDRNK